MILLLGDQLFPAEHLQEYRDATVFMAEDWGLCTRMRHHQQKLVLFLAAMRSHARSLQAEGWSVDYHRLNPDHAHSYAERLEQALVAGEYDHLVHFEIEDRFMDQAIRQLEERLEIQRTVLTSPGFLTPREVFEDYLERHERPFMATFYREQRKRLGVLLDLDGKPRGGQWSFDADNRQKLPSDIQPPDLPDISPDESLRSVISEVRDHFADHPGDARDFRWPVTRGDAEDWLDDFVAQRLERFGPYQDAITTRHDSLFHSALSPMINLGLLTPERVLQRVLDAAEDADVPLSSLEGFVRQLIGWREFVRGVDRHFGEKQEQENAWQNHGKLTEHWYDGSTGIPPLDDAISQAQRMGWTHHIQRLMVIANLMNLAGIAPTEAYRWFMETHIDSADWVMGPNVYGMGLASDGGLMATKPYICGSNYLLKMSDYERGPWCDVVDGLYWRFVDRHRDTLAANPRMAVMTRSLDRLKDERKQRIFRAADEFVQEYVA